MPIDEIEVIKQKLVDQIKPIGVYLFGSFANGTAHADSDFDFYIIVEVINEIRKKQEGKPKQRQKKGEHASEEIDIGGYDNRGFTFGFATGMGYRRN